MITRVQYWLCYRTLAHVTRFTLYTVRILVANSSLHFGYHAVTDTHYKRDFVQKGRAFWGENRSV